MDWVWNKKDALGVKSSLKRQLVILELFAVQKGIFMGVIIHSYSSFFQARFLLRPPQPILSVVLLMSLQSTTTTNPKGPRLGSTRYGTTVAKDLPMVWVGPTT